MLDQPARRSIRLSDYDYAQDGVYFVTMCCQNRANLFGEVIGGEMRLNEAGRMVEKWWLELTNKFTSVELDEFVIMPNHFHGIVRIVGADLRVCPDLTLSGEKQGAHAGAPLQNPTLGSIMQWFKTMTTNEYIRGVNEDKWEPFYKRVWQRNYYEHIIRTAESLNSTRLYIQTNPAQWDTDSENPKSRKHE